MGPQPGRPSLPEEFPMPPKPAQWFVILSLFVRPSLALMIVQLHRMWVMPAFLTLAMLSIASCSSTVSVFKLYYPIVNEIVTTVANDVAPITISDGRIGWNDADKPYSKEIRGWQIDFGTACDEARLHSVNALHGVCVTTDSIDVWFKDFPEHGKFRIEHLWKERQIRKLGDALAKKGENGFDRDSFISLGKMSSVLATPLIGIAMFLRYFWVILLCQIIFCITTAFMRRDSAYTFTDLVVLSISLSMIPTLVSLVWHAAAPPSWSFDNIYFAAFVIYMLYAFHDAKRGMVANAGNDERP